MDKPPTTTTWSTLADQYIENEVENTKISRYNRSIWQLIQVLYDEKYGIDSLHIKQDDQLNL